MHFVLDKEHRATFQRERPHDATHVGTVHARANGWAHTLELWRVADSTAYGPMPHVKDRSFLASTLQKAVRRSRTTTAAMSALELAHLDPMSLARRLPIVAVEDVCVDQNLVTAVWLMLAFSTRAVPSCEDIVWMVTYAGALAGHAARDARFRSGEVPSCSSMWRRASESDDHAAMALVIRATFGGMLGDVQMLLRAAAADHVAAPVLAMIPHEVDRLTRAHVIPEAVDFHCEPAMLDEIAAIHGVDAERVKTAIWHNASKTNVRVAEHPEHEVALWNAILVDVRRIQYRRINRAVP